jgi:4-carboxymuconolactone decarboxylase
MSDRPHDPAEPQWLFRAFLIPLGLVQLVLGAWAVAGPRSFYDSFPFGRGWVEALPAYNEHLLRDVGGLWLGTAVLLVAAGWWLGRGFVAIALVAWLAYAVPHTVYHVFNLEPLGTGDAIANVVALLGTVIPAAGLLALLARPPTRSDSERTAAVASNGNARIAGVSEGSRNPLVRMAYRSSRRQTGTVVDPVKVFAHHPTILAGYGAFEMAAKRSHRVDERLKHLGETRAAMLAGCEWCLDFASGISEEAGVTEDDLRDLPTYRSSDRFSDTEKLVLDYATGISRTPVDVPDELFDRLRERFDEAQLVELTTLIALENFRARFNWAFGIGSQGFAEGAYCVRPEGASATATA